MEWDGPDPHTPMTGKIKFKNKNKKNKKNYIKVCKWHSDCCQHMVATCRNWNFLHYYRLGQKDISVFRETVLKKLGREGIEVFFTFFSDGKMCPKLQFSSILVQKYAFSSILKLFFFKSSKTSRVGVFYY